MFVNNDQTKYEDLLVKLTKIFRLRLYIEIKIKRLECNYIKLCVY